MIVRLSGPKLLYKETLDFIGIYANFRGGRESLFAVHDVGNSEGWPEDLCKQLYYGQAPPFVSTNMGS